MGALSLHEVDLKEFLAVVDQCKGDVFLETAEGDRLNLKSKLCQMIGIASIVEGGKIEQANIRCADPEDDALLFRFNLFGKKE